MEVPPTGHRGLIYRVKDFCFRSPRSLSLSKLTGNYKAPSANAKTQKLREMKFEKITSSVNQTTRTGGKLKLYNSNLLSVQILWSKTI